MFLVIVGFVAGVFVGYKYPSQVEQVLTSAKKMVNDLKDKVSKKGNPPQSPSNP